LKGQQAYRVGAYCRLSRDDEGKSESASISTQKAMITKYAQENGWEIVDYYVDDGASGLTFQRPDFIRMINDIDKKRVNMVITKDLSRLGRDYILTGHYVEVYFPSKDVRYIAINDGIDTIHDNNDMAPFKAVINEMYAKDISKKIRSALKTKARQGYFLGTYAPYGYMNDPDDYHKLIVDEESAEIVRRVFRMYLQGESIGGIVRALNDDNVDTPMRHAMKVRPERFKSQRWYGDKQWVRCTVRFLLSNITFLGHMVNSRQRSRSFKCKELVKNDKSDWIIVENTHEPIICQADFDEVQRMLETNRKPRADGSPHLFSGLLRCADCGRVMVINKSKYHDYFCCSGYKLGGKKVCGSHSIRHDVLAGAVLEDIRYHAKLAETDKDAILAKLLDEDSAGRKDRMRKLADEIDRISSRESVISRVFTQLYEDRVNGVVNESHFISFRRQYDAELEAMRISKTELQDTMINLKVSENDTSRFIAIIEAYADMNEINSAIAHELIDRIFIGERRKEGREAKQEIRIAYKFVGEVVLGNKKRG